MELVFEVFNWLRPKVKIKSLKNILASKFGAHTHTRRFAKLCVLTEGKIIDMGKDSRYPRVTFFYNRLH